MKKMLRLFYSLILLVLFTHQSSAQINPTLNIQGILKRSNGVAVEDGFYTIVFKLYTEQAGGTAIWTETQPSLEVNSGIYNAVLGVISPLTVPFDKLYFLGATVGTTELTPRMLLTSAPYALSLIGQSNKFPSSGKVLADSIVVAGSVLARGGTPGLNGVNRNGYAFSGNNGDKDSGVFSTGDGKASLYSNNVEKVAVTPTKVQINSNMAVGGDLGTDGVAIINNGTISYNGVADWRLVETNYFENGSNGWSVYDKLSTGGYTMGWNSPFSAGAAPIVDLGSFIGDVMLPASNDHVLKKQFTIPGTFTQIKVKFRYYYIDTWGWGRNDRSWAAFSTNSSGANLRVGWTQMPSFLNADNGDFESGGTSFVNNASFYGDNAYSDSWRDAAMTTKATGNTFWVYIGAAVDEDAANERFAVGAIEVYVR